MEKYTLEKVDPNENRRELTALGVLRKAARFSVGGAAVALVSAAFGTFLSLSGFVVLGGVAEEFFVFGLLGHAWGRAPEEFWVVGAFAGAAAGFFRGVIDAGSNVLVTAAFHGDIGILAHAAVYITWAIVLGLGLRSAQYRRALGAAAALIGWTIGGRAAVPLTDFLRTRSAVLQLAAVPLGAAAQAGIAGLLLALTVALLCEEPPAKKP
ncbi:MAG: hypothetical protein HKL90_02950 [Elusimicrobia bacterium]|nr:hypothetical protein [Elusimicrobiota bacterium]